MKLIHCGDIHLDSVLSRNLTKEQARRRRQELLLSFEELISYAQKNDVEGILIAGDLFDSNQVENSTKKAVLSSIKKAKEITFFYLRGNHDSSVWKQEEETLPDNLKLFQDEVTYYELGECCIVGIELNAYNAESFYSGLQFDLKKRNIMLLHGMDARGGSEEETYSISVPHLKNKGIDYLALGHIHQYRDGWLDERGRYVYCGCLEGRGFDECGPKGFVLLEITKGQLNYEFVPFARRVIHQIEIDVTGMEETSQVKEAIETELAEVVSEDMVKVTLVGKRKKECFFQLNYLKEWLHTKVYVGRIQDESTMEIEQKDYQYDTSLKGAFVRQCLEEELPEQLRQAVMEMGLKALLGEEI